MNGAQSLLQTLVNCDVEVCFGNPGTSEMHFVAALDSVPQMRSVLCLFEGVVTGAADGYGRVAGKPAATLLHLGPGLANGLANLHNARRASTPLVNIVGDHATYHLQYDAPLTSDIVGFARPGLGVDPRIEECRRSGVGCCAGGPGRALGARLRGDADPPGRHRLERSPARRTEAAGPAADTRQFGLPSMPQPGCCRTARRPRCCCAVQRSTARASRPPVACRQRRARDCSATRSRRTPNSAQVAFRWNASPTSPNRSSTS